MRLRSRGLPTSGLAEGKFTKTVGQNDHGSSVGLFFGNHAEAQTDLAVTIAAKPNTVLIPGLNCSSNGPVWTNFANFRLFFNKFSAILS